MRPGTRVDPYKNFKFAVAMIAICAVGARLGRKLFSRAEVLHPGVYVEEVPAGTRPIEGVGTSTVGFVGSKARRGQRPRRQAAPRKSKGDE